MPVKIRLTRQGRKRRPIYHIVVADSRAPRDGRYIERLGIYNPNTNPATIDLNFDKALDWLMKGAQPTDTCRAILSYKGVLIRKHLLDGVKKGAFNEEEANARFEKWLKEKEAKIQAKVDGLNKDKESEAKKRLADESKIREAMAGELAKKRAEAAPPAASENEATEETIAEAEPAANEATEATAEVEPVAEETTKEEVATEEVETKKETSSPATDDSTAEADTNKATDAE